jgi:hypothetical protein
MKPKHHCRAERSRTWIVEDFNRVFKGAVEALQCVPLPLRLLIFVLIGATPVAAQEEKLDQEFRPTNNAGNALDTAVNNATARAQSFTMENGGTLASIEWFLTREEGDESATQFTIHRTTADGTPDDANTLFSGQLNFRTIPVVAPGSGVVKVGIAGLNRTVDAGDVLAISLGREVAATATWRGETGNRYTRGEAFVKNGDTWTPMDGVDLGFRVSIIDEDAPPKPKSFVLYPTANGIAFIDFVAGSSKSFSWPGNGPS